MSVSSLIIKIFFIKLLKFFKKKKNYLKKSKIKKLYVKINNK